MWLPKKNPKMFMHMCVHPEIHMEVKAANNSQGKFKIKKSSVGFSLFNFKTYYKALVTGTFVFI